MDREGAKRELHIAVHIQGRAIIKHHTASATGALRSWLSMSATLPCLAAREHGHGAAEAVQARCV